MSGGSGRSGRLEGKKMEGPAARTSYPQRTSSGQAVDEQILSSVPPNPTASDQTTLADSLMIDMGIEEERSPSEHRANETEIDDREQTSQVNDIKYIRDKLYPAAIRGDWQEANSIYKSNHQDKAIWELPITQQGMNTLQVAVAAKQTTFVKEVLDCMTGRQLEFQNNNEDTVLIINALSGNVEIAKMMVKMNKNLTMIRNSRGNLPLLTAAMHRQRDMVVYLYSVTEFNELNDDERIKLLLDVISCDLFVIADEIIIQDPKLATAEDKNGSIALEKLARKPFAIGSRRRMSAWENCIGSCCKGFYDRALMRMLGHQLVDYIWMKARSLPLGQRRKYSSTIFLAAELGNVEFLAILIRNDPDLIYMVDENEQNIFHISIRYRQENIFNLIYEIGVFKDMIATNCDKDANNMLHLAGEFSQLNIIVGPALHMLHELLWFEEVKKIVPLAFLKAKNSKEKTPKEVFTQTHQELHKDSEKWMRDTANHCMVVATLIATVVFAAAFTVPGGNNQGNGTPIFLDHTWFMVFFLSDSIAMLSASTSILIFLSILTSRYKEKDFLGSLPTRLLFGLLALFISIVGMVVAFGATCFLVYQSGTIKVPAVIIALVSVPIFSFLWLHYELFSEIISSTFLPRFLFRSRKRRFF